MKTFITIIALILISLLSFSQEKVNLRKLHRHSKKGYTYANYELGRIYDEGRLVKRDSLKAAEYYEIAAERDNPNAIKWMINFYGNQKDENPRLYFLWTEKAANLGDSVAIYSISKMYEEGLGCKKSLHNRFHYCEKAAKKGYTPAQKDMIEFYMTGFMTDTSFSKALSWHDTLAMRGDIESQNYLASLYYSGFEIDWDISKAIDYYILAGENNDPIAQVCLLTHFSGKYGTKSDSVQFKYWYQRFSENPNLDKLLPIEYSTNGYIKLAYEQNHPIATMAYWSQIKNSTNDTILLNNVLGSLVMLAENQFKYAQYQIADYCFQNRKKIDYNQKLILDYAKSANKSGIPEAKALLSEMFKDKYGRKHYRTLSYYYHDAIKNDIYWAADSLIVTYINNGRKDLTIEYFNKYKDICSPETYYKISYEHYLNDYGISNVEAISYCQHAIDNHFIKAELLLATYYYEGFFLEKDCKAAFEILNKEKLKEFAETDYRLSQIYMTACEVEEDLDKAYTLLKRSADNGFPKAQYDYAELINKGTFNDIPRKESFKYYELAAIGGINEAQLYVGRSYYDGIIVKKDDEKAFRYLSEAKIREDVELHYILAKLICEMSPENPDKDMQRAAYACLFAIDKGNTYANQLYYKYNLEYYIGILERPGVDCCH